MSAQHTPGPWIVDAAAEVVYGTSAEGKHIVVVYELNTNEADARLIAATPELFEIVNRLARLNVALHNGNSSAEVEACRLADMAVAAIAMATGSKS